MDSTTELYTPEVAALQSTATNNKDNLLVAVPTNMISTVTSLVSSACPVSVCTLMLHSGQLSVTLHVLNNVFGLHYVLIYLLQILSTLTCTCDTNKLHAPRGRNVLQISGAVDFIQQKRRSTDTVFKQRQQLWNTLPSL